MHDQGPRPSLQSRRFTGVIVAIGLAIAFFGLAIDYIFAGASPGLNALQMLIVSLGLAIAIVFLIVREQLENGTQSGRRRERILVGVLLSLEALVLIEAALAFMRVPAYFPAVAPKQDVIRLHWQGCDDYPCTFLYDAHQPECMREVITERRCLVNSMGYFDTDEFVERDDIADRVRILFMGDSFTAGVASDIGKSYVETVESALPDSIVWNVAVPGSGTSQDVAAIGQIGPLLQPQLTVLGFYMNDYRDNLYPLGSLVRLQDGDGNSRLVEMFDHDRWGNPVELPESLVYSYLVEGSKPPTSELERMVGSTRIGSLVLRALDKLAGSNLDHSWTNQLRLTRQYLAQLRDSSEALESAMLTLLIPHRDDFVALSKQYIAARELMREIAIPYLDPFDLLSPIEDYAPPPDGHWNSAGHQKIGAYLLECINVFVASGKLEDCDNVVMPQS